MTIASRAASTTALTAPSTEQSPALASSTRTPWSSSTSPAAAGDVEELYGVRVEIASAGDCPVDGPLGAVVLAAREAMTNAAKFAGVDEIDVYVEVSDDEVAVFVRDRGAGFDRRAVPADRRGLAESIEGRLERAGGRATIVSSPDEGTEVELHVARSAS